MTRRIGASLLATALAAGLGGCLVEPPYSPPASTAATPGPTDSAASPACAGVDVSDASGPVRPWADRVFYEVFVRSFADSDGDGIGDLAGATARLDYLNDGDPSTTDDLGVTGIWLMPIAVAASYHGYDVTDYESVEPDYGDAADLKAFVQAAHDRGIAVIADFVMNHTSIDHPWFRDALAGGRHRDWYIWSATDPGWPPVAGPNPWHRTAAGDYYYGAFWQGMPDLNLRNPAVRQEMERIAGNWLDDGLDGLRLDAAKHLIEVDGTHQANTQETLDWLAEFTRAAHAGHPDALILSEVFDISRTAGSYVPDSSDLTFDFGLAAALVSAAQRGRAAPIRTALDETLRFWPANRAASFLSNHDQNRVMSQLNGDVDAARLAGAMLMAAPGVPFVYYGEEIGMVGTKPDERIRTPMQWSSEPGAGFSTGTPWEALADGWQAVNVAAQNDDPASLLATYRQAIGVRAATPALRLGRTFVVDGGAESVIGWVRAGRDPDQTVLVVANVGTKDVADYGLTLDAGPLCGITAAQMIGHLPGSAAASPEAPEVTSTGGFDEYRPLPVLPARSLSLIELLGR